MRSLVRWLVPVAVAATVAGGVAVSSAQAGSTPDLPGSTPQQVLASVAGSSVRALSGTVVTRADVGLPSVSGFGGRSGDTASDPAGLVTRFLTGKNTLRVWVDGPTKQRAQLVDPFSELDVVRNGTELWTYASRGNAVQHGTLPAHPATGPRAGSTPAPSASATGTPADLTPQQLAERAIAAADPTTAVTLGDPALVAGRNAYTLTLTPRTAATLVGRVVISVDAANGVPLRVQVFARGTDQAAIETGFTAVDFATPAAERFTFTPPAGATVTQLTAPSMPQAVRPKPPLPASGTAGGTAADRPTVTGSGWASIVEVPASALQQLAAARTGSTGNGGTGNGGTGNGPSGSSTSSAQGLAALEQLTTPVAGGRAISTSLLSVLITTDGRVLAGSVPVQALVDAAAK